MSSFISTIRAFLNNSGSKSKSATSVLDSALSEISAISRTAGQSIKNDIVGVSSSTVAHPSTLTPLPSNYTGIFTLLYKSNKELQETAKAIDLATLAQALYSGTSPGVPRDIIRASKLWVLAAGKGDLNSLLQIGLSSIDGLGMIPKDWARAHGILLQLVEKANHPWAHFALATLLLRRRLLAEESAHNKSSTSSSSSSISSSTSLSGVDVSRIENRTHPDCIRALMSFTSAAESGIVPPSFLNLANCLAHGIGTARGESDKESAGKWLVLAAQRGDPMACVLVAQTLRSNKGINNSNKTATLFDITSHLLLEKNESQESLEFVWWRRAAVNGHPAAMHNIAMQYLSSVKKEERDPSAALIWLERAAELGLLRSRLNAGLLLERGAEGVTIDLDAAMKHFKKAKEQLESAVQLTSLSPTALDWHKKAMALAHQRLSRIAQKKLILSGQAINEKYLSLNEDENENDLKLFDVRIDFDSKEERDTAFKKLIEGSNQNGITSEDVHTLLQSYTFQPQEKDTTPSNTRSIKVESKKILK